MARTVEELNKDIKRLSKEIKAARKELKAFGTEADDAGDAVKDAGKAADRAGRDFKDSKEQLEGFAASMRAVGGNIGPMEDMATAFEKLGPAGFAAAAGVAALVGAAFAVAEFARVTVEATRAAGEMLEEWDHPEIFSDQAVAIDEANRALDELVTIGQMLQVLFAAEMSPTVQKTVDAIIALGLAISDVVGFVGWGISSIRDIDDAVFSWRDSLYELLGPFGDLLGLITPFTDKIAYLAGGPLLMAEGAFTFLGDSVDALTESYRDDIEAIKDQADALQRAAGDVEDYIYVLNEAFEAEKDFVLMTDRERDRLYAENERRRRREAAEEERARKAKAAADKKAREEKAREEEKARQDAKVANNKAAEDKRAEDEKAAEEAQRLLDDQTDAAERAAKAEADALEDAMALAKAAREDAAYATLGLMDAVLAAEQNRFDTETAEGRRAAKSIYQARRAVAIAEVALSSVVAMQNAAALPWPANIPAVVAAGVTSTANAIAVAAVPPPSFPIGGLVPSDHQLIGAQAGEGILSTAAVRALGEEQVGAMNRGTAGGAPIEVAMVYRHRVFDRFVQDNLRRSDSPLAGAIQGARRKRKRRR